MLIINVPGFVHSYPQPLKQQIWPPVHLDLVPGSHCLSQDPITGLLGHGPTGVTGANIQKNHFIYYALDNY